MAVILNATCFEWTNLIFNILVAIGTIAAVIVAVSANKKSNEQLISALKIHEQSKNIDLLEKRIEIIGRIEKREEVSLQLIKLFFNSDKKIINLYSKLSVPRSEIEFAEADMEKYRSLARIPDGYGGVSLEILDTILSFERKLDEKDCPDSVKQDFKSYCDSHILSEKDPITGEIKHYDYYSIQQRIVESYIQIDELTTELCKTMEAFVEDSIKPLITGDALSAADKEIKKPCFIKK